MTYTSVKTPKEVLSDAHPSWLSEPHRETVLRFAETNPTFFYRFAFAPDLTKESIDHFLNGITFHNDPASFTDPLDRADERISKKVFGQYITPQNSPVQPERFMGYHTAVDYEVFDDERLKEVEVQAACGGRIKLKQHAQGYGGVLIQDCLIEDQPITVIYGHMDFDTLTEEGKYVAPGDIIGSLGSDNSVATGGERKHLHLGFHKGRDINLLGYVGSEQQLEDWIDPCMLICESS